MNAIDANRQAALMGLYYYGEAKYRPQLTPPANLPAQLSVVSPADAIQYLEQDRFPGYESSVRLALAQLASAHAAFANQYANYVGRLVATLPHILPDAIVTLPQNILGESDAARAERYFQAYLLAGGGGCGVRNFKLTTAYQQHVSDVTASIEVNRPVDDFADGLDPRNWTVTLPNIWDDSYEIRPWPPQPDRRLAPPQATSKSPLPLVDVPLFEKADWSYGFGQPFAYWRTILRVQLDRLLGAGANSFIRFDYSLFECLENEFFGLRRPGGIDVDHGHGDCQPVAGDPTWSTLEARKVVRFTQPDLAINDLAFAFLILWISSVVLIGACA
jgi:hypothetical protein